MADTYVQFSEGLELRTKAESEWIHARYEFFRNPPDEESDEWSSFAEACTRYEVQDLEYPALEFELEETDNGVIFYADECGNPYQVAMLVQDFLRAHEGGNFSLTWSVSSNRHRPGSFGGGALFVTERSIEMLDTHQWCNDKMEELLKG